MAASADTEDMMKLHKFAVGRTVDLLPAPSTANIPAGRYTIQRLLPTDRGEPQYRVKHTRDGHERVLLEGQFVAL
jgi:hypothetical protein